MINETARSRFPSDRGHAPALLRAAPSYERLCLTSGSVLRAALSYERLCLTSGSVSRAALSYERLCLRYGKPRCTRSKNSPFSGAIEAGRRSTPDSHRGRSSMGFWS
jgi:hypothetical protein